MTQTLPKAAAPDDLLRISDLDAHQFEHLLYQAACMKASPFEFQHHLPGRMISCYFEKPSTRTRVSFAGAAARLGMTATRPRSSFGRSSRRWCSRSPRPVTSR